MSKQQSDYANRAHLHVIDNLLEQTAETTVGGLFDADIHGVTVERRAVNRNFLFSSRFHFNPLKIISCFSAAIGMVFYV